MQGSGHLPSNWRQLSVLFKQDAWSKTAAGANQLPMVLGNAQVYGIAASAGGSMWLVGTSGVLDELDPESGAVRHVFTSRPQRVLTAVFESADGKVWVGFGDGLGRCSFLLHQKWSAEPPVDPVRIQLGVSGHHQVGNAVVAVAMARALGVDNAVADQWGRMSAIRSVPVIDGLLAATAVANGLTLVTRNETDVAGLGAKVLNPFKAP